MPDLKQELRSLADRRSAESTTDFDAVLTAAAGRRRRRTGVWSAVAAAVVAVAAIVTITPWQNTADPAPATTESPRYPVTVSPATARPGALVALTFPGGGSRGVAFKLAKTTDPANVLYYLTSDWGKPSKHKPGWWPVSGNWGWVDVGISGPGPDHVVVPDTAEDGTYLLCTANAHPELCGLLTVKR